MIGMWFLTFLAEVNKVFFFFRLPITLFRGAFLLGLLTLKEPHHCIMQLAITIWPSAGFYGVWKTLIHNIPFFRMCFSSCRTIYENKRNLLYFWHSFTRVGKKWEERTICLYSFFFCVLKSWNAFQQRARICMAIVFYEVLLLRFTSLWTIFPYLCGFVVLASAIKHPEHNEFETS